MPRIRNFTCTENFLMVKVLLIIGSGSFLGGVSRYLASRYIQNALLSAFPYGTLFVNIFGSFLIGLFFGLSERGNLGNDEWRLFLTVGFCGGFTTFSTFSGENLALIRDGSFTYFALYSGLSVFLGLLAAFGGNAIIKLL